MKYDPNFINIELNNDNVFVYSVRKSLQKALDKSINEFSGTLLDLGCGEMPYKQYILDNNKAIKKYIGVDVSFVSYHRSVEPDLYWNGSTIPIENNSVDTVIATELFEHIPNIEIVLKEIFRVLRKGGTLYFTVPFIWPLHETPFDEYRYTPYSLLRHLKNTGFNNNRIMSLGSYNAALAQILCIWTALKKGMTRNKSLFLCLEIILIFPLIKYLLNKDSKENIGQYSENTIPTGFYALIRK